MWNPHFRISLETPFCGYCGVITKFYEIRSGFRCGNSLWNPIPRSGTKFSDFAECNPSSWMSRCQTTFFGFRGMESQFTDFAIWDHNFRISRSRTRIFEFRGEEPQFSDFAVWKPNFRIPRSGTSIPEFCGVKTQFSDFAAWHSNSQISRF